MIIYPPVFAGRRSKNQLVVFAACLVEIILSLSTQVASTADLTEAKALLEVLKMFGFAK